MKLFDVFSENILSSFISVEYDLLDLSINKGCRLLGIVSGVTEATSEEYLVVFILRAVNDGAEIVTHTELGYHIASKVGSALNIV